MTYEKYEPEEVEVMMYKQHPDTVGKKLYWYGDWYSVLADCSDKELFKIRARQGTIIAITDDDKDYEIIL